MQVKDLMTTDVITIGPDATLKEAARRMIEAGVSGLPVTDEGALIGVVTEADFVAGEAGRRNQRRAGLLRFVFRDESLPDHEMHIGDVMTAEVISIGPNADHAEAARVMHDRGIKRIPVVDEVGSLVGLISRSDIMRAFTRSDDEIIDEITGVMRKILWIDPNRARMTSVDGHVVLRGQLETRSDVNLLEEMVRRVDGVVSVENHMSFEVDNNKETMISPSVGMPTRGW